MTTTIYGVCLTKDGLAASSQFVQGTNGPELRQRSWATPSVEVRTVQAHHIPVNREHTPDIVGRVIHLELDNDARLWAVAEVDDRVTPGINVKVGGETRSVDVDAYWSAEWDTDGAGRDIKITGLALTASPARLAARPLRFAAGDANQAAFVSTDRFERSLLRRAVETHLRRRYGAPIIVGDLRAQQPPVRVHGENGDFLIDHRGNLIPGSVRTFRPTEIEHRPCGPILRVGPA